MKEPDICGHKTPRLLHFIIITMGVFALAVLYMAIASASAYRDLLFTILGTFGLGLCYYKYRQSKSLMASLLGVFGAFLIYIICAESLFFFENTFGFNRSERLELGVRLQRLALHKQNPKMRSNYFETLATDKYSYRRVPGSVHRSRYDSGKGDLYEVEVDETGFLNKNREFYNETDVIDVFISGDSVLQGVGMPSCVERIKGELAPEYKVWNLSTGSYAARQKVNALITFGLPKKPKYLIIDFYSGNDASEANEDYIIELYKKTFEARFSVSEMKMLFERNSEFSNLVGVSNNKLYVTLSQLRANSLTLSMTRYLFLSNLFRLNQLIEPELQTESVQPNFTFPAYTKYPLSEEKETHRKWIELGMKNTLRNYVKLIREAGSVEDPPKIILLYNPTSYEIYEGVKIDADSKHSFAAKLQQKILEEFSKKNGIIFINLLPRFRELIGRPGSKTDLYGIHDSTHWSKEGTNIAGAIIAKELKSILMSNEALQ
tara:strand:- start:3228 stop:4697 length:1470 start_codon:yes stop_codon:yes gene_type:complete